VPRSRRGKVGYSLLGLGLVVGLLVVAEKRPEWLQAGAVWYFERIHALAMRALSGMFQQ